MKYSKENKTNRGCISKGTWTQKQSSRWHFSSNERIGENCETKTADSAVKDHKSNARARMGKTREDLGTNYLLSSGKTEGRRLKPVFLRPIFFFKFVTICLKVWLTVPGNYLNLQHGNEFLFIQRHSFSRILRAGCDWFVISISYQKKTLCHVHLMSRAIQMLKKDFFNYPGNVTCKNINKGKQLTLNKARIIKTGF